MKHSWNLKRNVLFVVLLVAALFFQSCSEKDGDWDDNIKLSTKEATFTVQTDSTTFITEGEGWWISGVSLNGTEISLDNINTTEDNFEFTNNEIVIRRNRKTELFVKMNENTSTEERILRIGLQAGNYFDGITITQQKE